MTVEALLKAGADPNSEIPLEETPVNFAVASDLKGVAKVLLKAGADPDLTFDENLTTPLHNALEEGSDGMVRILLDGGASVNVQDGGGQIALHFAFTRHACETRDNSYLVREVLEAGADPNINSGGDTPFHLAVHLLNEPMVRDMLDHGADLNLRNGEGQTPLEIAKTRETDGYQQTGIIIDMIESAVSVS